MKYCPKCGSPNRDAARVCETCNYDFPAAPQTLLSTPTAALKPDDRRWIFLGNLCFSPVLGLVLYLAWKDSSPTKADEVCKLTWWTAGIWAILLVLIMVVGIIAES